MTKYFAALLMFFVAWPSFAADPNGYTSQYECRAGGPNCNVDVVTYVTAACATTITTADSLSTIQSKLDNGSSPICITNGDYTGKGTIWISGSGSSGAYRVLRYTRSDDNNDDPWNQTSGNQAKIQRLVVAGSYWIIHRITLPPVSSLDKPVHMEISGNATHVIVNRIALYGSGPPSGYRYYGFSEDACGSAGYSDITFQNSVLGGYYGNLTNEDAVGLDAQCTDNFHIVNNELYDWAGGIIQNGSNSGGARPGTVIENNDCYYSSLALTQGGTRMKGEGCISFKQSGTSGSPAQIIHNRIWSMRVWDPAFCCNGSSGSAVGLGSGGGTNSDWILFQNNIVFDSQAGIEWTHWNTDTYGQSSANHNSIIGNIFYGIKNYLPSGFSAAWWAGQGGVNTTEHYLNTTIDSAVYADGPFNSNNDFSCNVAIAAGTNTSSQDTGTQWEYNVYYGTTNRGETNKLDKTLTTRSAGATYSLNQIIRTSATPTTSCIAGTESACFLYKVITAGTTSGSPAYCTTLGCTQTDGTAVLQAIRGPYTFKRKLRTVAGGETVAIPYARAHSSAQEPTCINTLGSRYDIGINNSTMF